MAARGPKPKPRDQKIRDGEKNKARLIPEAMQSTRVLGAPPDEVRQHKIALEKWNEITSMDYWGSVIRLSDRDQIIQYCILEYHRVEQAKLVNTDAGYGAGSHTSSAFRALMQTMSALRGIAQEFGGTPASRARVTDPNRAGDSGDIVSQTLDMFGVVAAPTAEREQ